MRKVVMAGVLLAMGSWPADAMTRPAIGQGSEVGLLRLVNGPGGNFPYMVLKPPRMPGPAQPRMQALPTQPAARPSFSMGEGGLLRQQFGTTARQGMLRGSFGVRRGADLTSSPSIARDRG